MTPTKISYGRTIPLGSFNSERLEVEVEIGKDETPEEAFAYAKELIEKIHRENNPQLYPKINNIVGGPQPEKEPPISHIKSTIPLSKEQRAEQQMKDNISNTIQQVNEITDIAVLKTFKKLCYEYPQTKDVYDLRIEQLEIKKQTT